MSSSEQVLQPTSARWPARILGPRPALLVVFSTLVLALLIAFGYLVLRSQSDSRRQSEQRFDAEAAIASQLTASLFTSSSAGAQAAAAKKFGADKVSQQAVDASLKSAGLKYTLILDQGGKVIASSTGASALIGSRAIAAQPHVQAALGGKPMLSDVLIAGSDKTPILEWALPYKSPAGPRVQVEGLGAASISKFLSGYLGKTRIDGNGAAFVLDSQSKVVAVAGTVIKAGGSPKSTALVQALAAKSHGSYGYTGSSRYYAAAPVDGTRWRVVLTVRTSSLYPPLAGSESWFLYAVLAAFGAAGIASLVFFRHNLQSGRKLERAVSELSSMNATLEDRVAERTAAAEARARELARSNEELEHFSSVASHDLQEPLRKIRMFGDRLREKLGDSLAEDAGADLERMSNAAERMQRLINDLLDYSRVTHRGREFETVDLGKITQDVVADLEARVVELDASINVGDMPVVEADGTQMRQLMQNLVGNALKFHRDGEAPVVTISSEVVSEQRPRFAAEAAAGARCVITVRDNGIGFDEKHAERVFTAFERLHSRSDFEGTGIGLSIARKIVWRHGGHIKAMGSPDEGATFTVTLPLSQPNGHDGGNKQ